jgi:hypothetical protein
MSESFQWTHAFSKAPHYAGHDPTSITAPHIRSLRSLRAFLDIVHIKHCLLKPFFEHPNYPVVESRELLPSFETDPFEYKELPGFSMVAFERPTSYFQEIFQFDILHPLADQFTRANAPLRAQVPLVSQNLQSFMNRLPKHCHEQFKAEFGEKDVADLVNYPDLMPYLLQLDRAHALAMDGFGNFGLTGVYASFPSDLDAEIKRFGMRIGKFEIGNDEIYERNRTFVYQFLMELYGFPIVSERRTSSALFARRLHKMGETFLVKVLGQTDRTITSLYSDPAIKIYPRVEKVALVRVDNYQEDAIQTLYKGGFFVDAERKVVILRVRYRQHKYDPNNIRQERALSVETQEVIHPLTGEALSNLNLIKDSYNMFLRLNDIVRGEYTGRTVFKRFEIVENTDTTDKRLKFLFSWLSKHQRRIISYSEDFFANIAQVLDNYLLNPDNYEQFQSLYDLYQEVWGKYSYIQQARKVKRLEDILALTNKGKRGSHLEMLRDAAEVMHELKFETVHYIDELVSHVIHLGERVLNDNYLRTSYLSKKDSELTAYGHDVKRLYRKIVSLVDEFKAIRKSRAELPDDRVRRAG